MVRVPSLMKPLPGVVVVLALLSGCASGGTTSTATSAAPYELGSEDQMRAMVACMQDRGWDASYDESDGSMLVSGVDDSQRDQRDADDADCSTEVGMDAPPPDLSDEQLTALYRHELATAECLRGLGVDVSEAPSEAVFKETYGATSGWYAYRDVVDVDEETWEQYNQACPQTPEGW